MKHVLFIGSLLLSLSVNAQLRVAVIDTGAPDESVNVRRCKESHKDFTGTSIVDDHGHGGNVSAIIDSEAGNDSSYCQVFIKFYSTKARVKRTDKNPHTMTESIKYATSIGVDVINISGGGVDPSPEEQEAIKVALDKGIIVVAAAGNEAQDFNKSYDWLDVKQNRIVKLSDEARKNLTEADLLKMGFKKTCSYYPACYDDRIIVVGNLQKNGQISPTSSFGLGVDFYTVGTNIYGAGRTMTGTSQATAVATGNIIKSLLLKKKADRIIK